MMARWLVVCVAMGCMTAPLSPRSHAADAAATGAYAPEWESLKRHTDPEWFRDAKFGIYTHWGPVTVGCEDCPAGGQWYGREMYDPKSPVFAFHARQFGPQDKVGYKDILPRFAAPKFNADAWADLFAKAGAKFAGPVAVHHDNFAMWDSRVTPWNSVAIGPRRDVTGELAQAIRRRGMRLITTFHHGFAWRYYEPAFAFDAADPKYALLYTEAHAKNDPPSRRFLEQWLAMVNEAVGKYQPDLIWFDFELDAVITPEFQRRMFADYYNWAAASRRESGVAHKHRNIHQYTGILDFERGREDRLVPYPWLTDTAVGPWFHNKASKIRSADNLIDVLVDIVAKNGCLLLNVGPAADGSIPEEAGRLLLDMGDWLRVNGEAIYCTRPWTVYGEGPTRSKGGGFSERADKPFTAEDIRFTTKGATLYAVALDWPKDGKLLIRSLAKDAGQGGAVEKVELLGHAAPLKWSQAEDGLSVLLPDQRPCKYAVALKIAGQGLRAAPVASGIRPAADRSVLLEPYAADLEGKKIRVEQRHGEDYIAAWDRPDEWVHWTTILPAGSRYEVEMVYSAAAGGTSFALEVAGQKLLGKVDRTDSWFNYATIRLGKLEIGEGGKQTIAVRAVPEKWKPLNIRSIRLCPLP